MKEWLYALVGRDMAIGLTIGFIICSLDDIRYSSKKAVASNEFVDDGASPLADWLEQEYSPVVDYKIKQY